MNYYKLLITHNMGILETIALILFVLWIGGFALHIAGGLIHILLVAAVIVFLLRFFQRSV